MDSRVAAEPTDHESTDPYADNGTSDQKLAGNMAAVAFGKAIVVVVGLASMAILARCLGPVRFGDYRTAITYISLAAVPADLGLYMVTLREITRPGVDRRAVMSAALALRLITSIAFLSVAACLAVFLPYDHKVLAGIWIAVLLYAGFQGVDFLAAVFQATFAQLPRMIGEVAGGVAMLAAVGAVAWLGGGTLWMIGATAFGTAVTFVCFWWRAAKLIPFGLKIDVGIWRNLLVTGMPLAGSQILIVLILRGDTFILSLFHSAREVGLYGIPTKILEILSTLSYIFGGLMMGFFVRAFEEKDTIGFQQRLRDAMQAMLVLGLGIATFLQFYSANLLQLIGGKAYVDGAPALRLVGVTLVAQYLIHISRYALTAREQQGRVFKIDLCVFVTGLALYLALIPPLSFYGAALASAINEVITFAGFYWLTRRQGLHPLGLGGTVRIAGSAALFAIALWFCRSIQLNWIVAAIVSGVLYLGALMGSGILRIEFLKALLTPYRKGEAPSVGEMLP